MLRWIRAIGVFAVLLALGHSALAQKPQEILDRVGEVYSNLRAFEFHGTIQATVTIGTVQYDFRAPVEVAQGNTPSEPLAAQFGRGFLRKPESEAGHLPEISFGMPAPFNFSRIAHNVKSASMLREESLDANGKAAPCYVIDIVYRQADDAQAQHPTHQTVWVDKSTLLVLRHAFDEVRPPRDLQPELPFHWVTTFASYQLNAPPPKWLVGIKDAAEKEISALSAKIVGTQAPVFTLQDLNGHEFGLDRLRGKTVLLSFWATWCAPCRSELPLLAKLERDLSGKGLVVARVTEEPIEQVNRFLARTHQNFSTLVNGEAVAKQYAVRGIPTLVVVDQAGRIVSYDVNELGESALLQRLQRAGIQ